MTEQHKWLSLSITWTLFIYTTLPFVRPVCNYLKAHLPFSFSINFLLIATILYVTGPWILKLKKAGLVLSCMYILTLLIYIAGMIYLELPEERIHFLQYGILVYFVFRTLTFYSSGIKVYALSFIVVALIGWGDEGIQRLLPQRYFEWKDVGLNCISAALGLCLIHIGQRLNNSR